MLLFIKKLSIFLTVLYLCLIAIGISYSDKLIFLPQKPSYSFTNDLLSIPSKNYSIPNTSNTIVARYLKNPGSYYTLLYSHGNAVDMGGLKQLQQKFYNHGYSIIIYDYSGYGLSEGDASEQQVYNDVQAIYDYLIKKQHLKPEQIIAYGHSLGAAIATELAHKNPVSSLVLESPFITAFRVKTIYPIVPFDKFSTIDKINQIHAPVFITHSRDDSIIPFWHSEMLYEKANQPKKSRWFNNSGHSGITHTSTFWPTLAAFIASLH